MKGRSGEREREKIPLHQQTPMTLGLYSGVFLCLFLCPPSSPVVSCPNAAVWGMALHYVIACPGVPMGSWSLEAGGDREMQGGCPGWWVMLQRRAGPSRCERPFAWMDLHLCSSLTAIPTLFPPMPLRLPWGPDLHLRSWWAPHHWENALWEGVTHGRPR